MKQLPKSKDIEKEIKQAQDKIEFNLSERVHHSGYELVDNEMFNMMKVESFGHRVYLEETIKEFIKLVKNFIENIKESEEKSIKYKYWKSVLEQIDKLSGENFK